MDKQIRVRYAPSPTGHIHIGNARSALFNYLFARHNNGVLIMRLDDTDRKRSTDEAIKTMLNDIQWLGIDWDEGYLKGGDYGPYRQTERMDLYNHYIDILLSNEKAYELYYTEEEIHSLRDSYEKEGKKFSYRDLKEKETEQLRTAFNNKNLKPAIVFKVEKDKEIIVNDLVRGNVTFNSNEFKDFVIRRENGIPVYNYATVIDDALMKITHIIRAEEHLSNTPKQLFIFNALNFPPPQFAHISLILAPDRTKLSKRHGATSVGQYREMGFLPEALFNYLALLGWSSKDDREFFTKEELIKLFTLESVNKAPAIFDIDKLKWMNHHYISKVDDERLCRLALPFMIEEKWIKADSSCSEKLLNIVNAVKGNMETISDITKVAAPFFEEIDLVKTEENQRILEQEENKIVFSYLIEKLQDIEFTEREMDKFINSLKSVLNLSGKKIYHPMRVALIGSKNGPELTKIILILGKKRVIDRFNKVLNKNFTGTNL